MKTTVVLVATVLALMGVKTINAEDFSEKFVDIHGFVSQGFFASSNYNFLSEHSREGSWEMRAVGINFQKELGNHFQVGLQFLSRDEGVYGNNTITLDFAYGTFLLNDMFKISVGRNKIPLGIFTEVQDYDFLTPFAFMPSTIYEKGLRSVSSFVDGVQINGNFDFNRAGDLEYTATFGDIDTKNSDDMGYYLETLGLGTTQNTSMDFATGLGLAYNTPLTGLKLSASYLLMKNWQINKGHISVLDTYLDKQTDLNWFYLGANYVGQYFDLMAEWHRRFMIEDVQLSKLSDETGDYVPIAPAALDTVNRGGWYVGLNIKPVEWFNFGGYYQDYRDRYDDFKNGTIPIVKNSPANINRDGALTLAFKVKNILTVKLEGHLVYGTALLSKPMNSEELDNGQFSAGDRWQYGVIKASYNF
jgi:hypothetical protein